MNTLSTEFDMFADVPKADCHTHLTGSLTAPDMRSLARQIGIYTEADEGLEAEFQRPFHESGVWARAKEITSNPTGLAGALGLLARRAAEEGGAYMEITLNPYGMVRDYGITVPDLREAISDGAQEAADVGVQLKVKCGVNRRDTADSVMYVGQAFSALRPEDRTCVDLNGDEGRYPTGLFVPAFRQLIAQGIPVSLHAGEMGGVEQRRDSLRAALDVKPKRIGHAIVAAYDSSGRLGETELLRQMIDQDIIVEIAPTSNLRLGVVRDMAEHPIRLFVRAGLKVVLGTDDPAFFDNTMTSELKALVTAGLTPSEVLDVNRRSFELVGANASQ